MAENNDRVVYPDEVEAVKEAAAKSKVVQGGDSNSIEEPPSDVADIGIASRNMITVPSNCPPGTQMGIDGKCHQVFND